MEGIVTVLLFMDQVDHVYVVNITNRDRGFPINAGRLGQKIDDLPLEGEVKNQLIDIVSDTEKFGIIIRDLEITGRSYITVSILMNLISKNITIKNSNLLLYPHQKTAIMYFIESGVIKKLIKSVFFDQKFSILDFLKMFGMKNFIILFIIVEMLVLIIGPKIVEPIFKNYNQIIYNWITGDN